MLENVPYLQQGLALLLFLVGVGLYISTLVDEVHSLVNPSRWIDNQERIRLYSIKMGMIPLSWVVAFVVAFPQGWRYLICGIPVAGLWGWFMHRWLKVWLGGTRDFWYPQRQKVDRETDD